MVYNMPKKHAYLRFFLDTSFKIRRKSKMKKVSFSLLDTRGGYRVVAYCEGKVRNYATRDESLAEDIKIFMEKIFGGEEEPDVDFGENESTGVFTVIAEVDDETYMLDVESGREAAEIQQFIDKVIAMVED